MHPKRSEPGRRLREGWAGSHLRPVLWPPGSGPALAVAQNSLVD